MDYHRLPYPFKRPFKGKRIAVRDVEDLTVEAEKVVRQQERLCEEWALRTDVEGLSLAITRQGQPLIRWRASQRVFGKQRYVELFADSGREITSTLTQDAVLFILGYETHRLLLNARSKAVHSALTAFQHYVSETKRLEEILKS